MSLSTEERIALRDKLFNILKELKVIVIFNKTGVISISRRKNLMNALYKDLILYIQYCQYISEFKTEEEAIYCLLHHDDYTNHSCPICGNPCTFYNNGRKHYEYRNTCGNKECNKKIHQREECTKKRKASKKAKYNDENYNNREKAAKTCEAQWGTGVTNPFQAEEIKNLIKEIHQKVRGCDYPTQDPAVVAKGKASKKAHFGDENYSNPEKAKDTKRKRYGDHNYNNHKKAVETWQTIYGPGVTNPFQTEEVKQKIKEACMKKYKKPFAAQTEEVIEKIRKTRMKNKGIDFTTDEEIQYLFYQVCETGKASEIYSNAINLKEFIKLLYTFKNRLLKFNELAIIFDLNQSTIGRRIHELKLEEYFDIQDSYLELQIKEFLIDNDYIEQEDFTRHNHILRTENSTLQEIDFLVNNIGFEINDVNGHNITTKQDQYYHANKTKMAKDQHNIRLIHLWEWELDNQKIQNWILHILNQNKIQLNLSNCTLKYISKDEEIAFLNQYSITFYEPSDVCYGFYYNDKLVQVIYFNLIKSQLIMNICVKFGYNIINRTKDIIDYYLQNSGYNYIITYCELDKFTGKTFEELGFKLTQYQEPELISKFDTTNKTEQLYNCGYNVYILNK